MTELKPWPLGGYAPGNYICKCLRCSKQFEGDKRAYQCLECAAAWANDVIRRPSPSISEGEVEAVYDKGRELGAAALEEIGKMLIDAAAEVRSDNPFDLSKARATTEVEVKALAPFRDLMSDLGTSSTFQSGGNEDFQAGVKWMKAQMRARIRTALAGGE